MTTLNVSVVASADDCNVYWTGSAWAIFPLTSTSIVVGYDSATVLKMGTGLRFQNVTIPQGAIILTAHLTLVCLGASSSTVVKCRITGDNEDNAAVWSTIANYKARRGTVVGGADDTKITTAQVDWDSIPAWTASESYNSPEIKAIIQEIVDRAGWVSGNALALWWDDHDVRGTQAASTYRQGASWDNPTLAAPILHIEYSALPVVSTQLCTAIVSSTATGNGNISDLGSSSVTQHGHCWNTTGNPTTADNKTQNGVGAVGAFTSAITGLVEGTTYYVAAYATNSYGTSYGKAFSFIAGQSSSQMSPGNIAVKLTYLSYIGYDGIERYILGTPV